MTLQPVSLETYRRKRDFSKTPEPDHSPAVAAARQLVVQHHYARREHFDLRLEIDGVLVSWAVARGPSANPKDKRLAVRTEDHPLSYGLFEGTIPAKEYGAGTVVLWEYTTYTALNGPPTKALKDGQIKFESHGTRMRGRWVLVRMKTDEKRENWLLIKEKDEFAEKNDSLSRRFLTGINSLRTRRAIEKGLPGQKTKETTRAPVQLPSFVDPQLCRLVSEIPEGKGWAFELKYDGYRLLIAADGTSCRIYTRTGLDWTKRFPRITQAIQKLRLKSTLLDGEAAVLDAKGIADFPALVNALDNSNDASVIFVAFDILFSNGNDVRQRSYVERKKLLRSKIPRNHGVIRYGDYVSGRGEAFFREAMAGGAEGIIAKLKAAPYMSGRGDSWQKIKSDARDDVEVVGYMPSTKNESFASLLAAQRIEGELHYAGRIGTGFNSRNRALLAPLLQRKAPRMPEFANPKKLPNGAVFLEKSFAVEARFQGWTTDKQLRHARFIAIQRDRASPTARSAVVDKRSERKVGNADWNVSHEDRIVFPEAGVTKGQIASYYEEIWPRLEAHLRSRPLSLLRAPDNINSQTFFQRHPLAGMTSGIKTFGPNKEQYFTLDGEQGLATAAQFGTIELHGWNAVLPDLSKPDRMIFDLDPDEDLTFHDIVNAAQLLESYLSAASLKSFPLLSGGKGVHLVVPLAQQQTDAQVTAFAKQFAARVASDRPEVFVATMSKAKRKGRIFIDWLRNRSKSTAILPWSLRARPEASVAVPVTWEQLPTLKSARQFTIRNAKSQPDWAGFWSTPQRISPAVIRILKSNSR